MNSAITQRELRTQSAAVLREVEAGRTFVLTRNGTPVAESRGPLDTSVLIDHDVIDTKMLPDESAISAATLAELAAGPHATDNRDERARSQDRLQWAATT